MFVSAPRRSSSGQSGVLAPLLLLLVTNLVACELAPKLVVPPVFTPSSNLDAPLAGVLTLETDQTTQVTLLVDDGSGGPTGQWEHTFPGFATEHTLSVLRFKPGRLHTITIVVTNTLGLYSILEPLTWLAPELPDLFPEMTTLVSNRGRMEPGVTIFDLRQRNASGFNGERLAGGYLVGVDSAGDVVWYHRIEQNGPGDVKVLDSGRLLNLGRNTLMELDMFGNRLANWSSNGESDPPEDTVIVDTETFHHEALELPNGNYAVLSLDLRTLDDFPLDEDDLSQVGPQDVVGDLVVEFEPDGTIVAEYSLLDMLDPKRIGYLSTSGFHDRTYGGIPTADWTHGNSLVHDPRDDSYLVCVRHQDAIVKFSRQTGELIWILGTHSGWTADPVNPNPLLPDGSPNPNHEIAPPLLDIDASQTLDVDFHWHYHPHAPQITVADTMMLFDNGNFRSTPYEPENVLAPEENYSRAVEYEIDEETMTVRQVWEFVPSPSLYASFISDANMLPHTRNVLSTFGGITLDPETGARLDTPSGAKVYARIIEVTHQTPPTTVFDLQIGNTDLTDKEGWRVFRSHRIPTLYLE